MLRWIRDWLIRLCHARRPVRSIRGAIPDGEQLSLQPGQVIRLEDWISCLSGWAVVVRITRTYHGEPHPECVEILYR